MTHDDRVSIGKLTKLQEFEIRQIWPREAEDLSPWMKDNIDVLNEVLGLQIEIAEQEGSVGNFRLDLAGNDALTQTPVVIENQFGTSDHDHLGKLITYAAGREAAILVWVAMAFEQPHRDALDWLNNVTGPDMLFYGVTLEVFRIDDSKPAPRFGLAAEPPLSKRPKPVSPEVSPRAASYQAFWGRFLQYLRTSYPGLTRAATPQPYSWFSTGAGVSGFNVGASFTGEGKFRVELYIDTGNKEQNKSAFGQLKEAAASIEAAIGQPLDWQELPERRASRIALDKSGTIDDDAQWQDFISWGTERLAKFKSVFRPLLTRLTPS